MPYTRVQMIAHCVNTGPWTVDQNSQTYLGLQDTQVDITARLKMIKAAMSIAHRHANGQGHVLKVMMWPEFLFRGKSGAFEMRYVQRIVAELRKAVSDDIWIDWLFVFGTIVGLSRGAQPNSLEEFNYALIQKGGAYPSLDNTFSVLKVHDSKFEFIKSGSTGSDIAFERAKPRQPEANGQHHPHQRAAYYGGGIFSVAKDGKKVNIGIEIGHDYFEGRLARATPPPVVDIHLIPSCGAEIENWNGMEYIGTSQLISRNRGYAFNCDGFFDYRGKRLRGESIYFASDVIQIEDSFKTPQQIRRIDFSPAAEFPVEVTGALQLYVHGAGKVRVYPVQAL